MNIQHILEGSTKIINENVVGKVCPNNIVNEANNALNSLDASFYNPAQVFNRDISLLVVKLYIKNLLNEAFEKYMKSNKAFINPLLYGVNICELMCATGIRSIRYAKELPASYIKQIYANDLSESAIEAAKKNAKINNVANEKLVFTNYDANYVLCKYYYEHNLRFNIIDIDPYGSVSSFVETCIKHIQNGGLLCLTSTDMPVLGGNNPEVSFYKYGGCAIKCPFLHELSIRLVIHTLNTTAGKYKKYILPVLCLSIDFYIRLFVRVFDNPVKCSSYVANTALLLKCSSCNWFNTIPFGDISEKQINGRRSKKLKINDDNLAYQYKELSETVHKYELYSSEYSYKNACLSTELQQNKCEFCGNKVILAGPFYAGPLHDLDFTSKMQLELSNINTKFFSNVTDNINVNLYDSIFSPDSNDAILSLYKNFCSDNNTHKLSYLSSKTLPNIIACLNSVQLDLPNIPFYYSLRHISKYLKIGSFKASLIRNALLNLSYNVGIFHRDPMSIKTNAPYQIVLALVKYIAMIQSPDASNKFKMDNDNVQQLNSMYTPDIVKEHEETRKYNSNKLFMNNPEKNWGPAKKAKVIKPIN